MADHYLKEDFLGAHFSLSLELGSAENGSRAAVQSAFWKCPAVQGPWTDLDNIGRPDRTLLNANDNTQRSPYGLLTVSAEMPPMAFILYAIKEERAQKQESDTSSSGKKVQFGVQTQEPSDWLTLDIPVCILAAAWLVDDSWSMATQPWLATLCRVLADVANHVHACTPILGGVMGEEASGCWRVPTPTRITEATQGYPPLAVISSQAIAERGGFVITPEIWTQLTPNANYVSLPSGLRYVPPNPSAQLTGA